MPQEAPEERGPAAAASSAACGPQGVEKFDVAFLQYEERLGDSFRQHNEALKRWRCVAENAEHPFESLAK
eukprot:7754328-Pyramimonas_sp.AAC.1